MSTRWPWRRRPGKAEHPVPASAAGRDPGIDLAVATAVLDVARRLTSAELRRRLVEAITVLPDVTVVFPKPGDPFDADRHNWEDSVEVTDPDVAGTISETRSAGLADHLGTLRRRAGVVVHQGKGKQP